MVPAIDRLARARFAGLLLAALALPPTGPHSASADDKPTVAASDLPARVETRHSITLGGRRLDYRAVAETIGLTDPKGEPSAAVFTVSYLAEPGNGATDNIPAGNTPAGDGPAGGPPRPVAFVFNGGPGAAAVFLHLGALGPQVLESPPTGAAPTPPFRLIDNQSTWLPFTDLVFVDPVGTGFSRGKGKDDNPDKPFWNVRADLNSLGAVVRRWLTRHDRWGAPVYLVGESYGGLRAAALAQDLQRDVGITVSGLVLVSPALDLTLLHPDVSNTLAPAFQLPSYAAAAAALSDNAAPAEAGKAAEVFALSDYLVGLTALGGVPAPGDPFIARVAATIGLPAEIVRRERARVSADVFVRELRRSEGEILSSYDATVRRATPANPWDDHAGDPVLDPATAAYTMAFENYAAGPLAYHTEQPYRVLAKQVSREWGWEGTRGGANGGSGLGLALSSLENTLLAHPTTKLLIVNGRYDLVTPYLASRWLIDQLGVPATVRAGIRLRVYEGGHMMYMRPASRAALAADAASLFGADAAPRR